MGAAIGGVSGVQDDQARVVDATVRIFETKSKLSGQERKTSRVGRQIEGARAGQPFATADVIIQEETEPQHPSGPQTLAVRKHEAERPDDVRGDGPQHFAFAKRLSDKAKFVVLQIAQAAVDQLCRPRGRTRCEIILLAKITDQPRPAASRAIPQPLMPPPMMAMSKH